MNQEVPRDVLGIPGAYYQLWVHNVRRGEDPQGPFNNQQDKYRIVFTLSRHPLDKQNLDFKGAGLFHSDRKAGERKNSERPR